MRLLLDEDLRSHELIARLQQDGHLVEVLPTGTSDEDVWLQAQQRGLSVLTRNADDFRELVARTAAHRGLLLVHGEHDPAKSMRAIDIAAAIGHVQDAYGASLPAASVIDLNAWRRPRSK